METSGPPDRLEGRDVARGPGRAAIHGGARRAASFRSRPTSKRDWPGLAASTPPATPTPRPAGSADTGRARPRRPDPRPGIATPATSLAERRFPGADFWAHKACEEAAGRRAGRREIFGGHSGVPRPRSNGVTHMRHMNGRNQNPPAGSGRYSSRRGPSRCRASWCPILSEHRVITLRACAPPAAGSRSRCQWHREREPQQARKTPPSDVLPRRYWRPDAVDGRKWAYSAWARATVEPCGRNCCYAAWLSRLA